VGFGSVLVWGQEVQEGTSCRMGPVVQLVRVDESAQGETWSGQL